MKDFNGTLLYKDKEYTLVFNLNVMAEIQHKYGSLDKWGELTDGAEPDASAVIFGFMCMMNEGIDMANDNRSEKEPLLTEKQVGRIITEVGFQKSSEIMNQTVIDSTKSEEKNS